MTTTVYAAAYRQYLNAGWLPLPIPYGAKEPPPPGTTGRHSNPSPADYLRWATDLADHNIATRLPDGIIGIDVDHYANKLGGRTLADLETELGPLPATWTSTSRTDGISGIRFYRVPVGTRLVGGVGGGIDIIQHHHRYALAAPSLHPSTGRPYLWISPEGEIGTDPPDTDELPELPFVWIDALDADYSEPVPAGPDATDESGTIGTPSVQVLRAETTILERIQTGASRHDSVLAGVLALTRLDTLGHPGAADSINRIGSRFVAAVSSPGDRQTIEGATREWSAICTSARDVVARTAATSPTYLELVNTEHTITIVTPDGVEVEITPDSDGPHPYQPWETVWSEHWATDHKAEDFLCPPILARGRGHALYAAAKTGKSLLALEMAAALATGREFLGHTPDAPVSVLYIDFEMTSDDLNERMIRFGYGPDDDLSLLHYVMLPAVPPLDTPEGGTALLMSVDRWEPDLVVVDTTARAVSGEENAAETIRDLYKNSLMILKQRGITTLRIDHAGKSMDKGQRGSSAKNDDVDIVWQLISHGEGEGGTERLKLNATHRRVGWVPETVDIERSVDGVPMHIESTTGYPAGTADLIEILDGLEISSTMSRDKFRAAYPEIEFSDKIFGHAQRSRRNHHTVHFVRRNSSARTVRTDPPETVPNDHDQPVEHGPHGPERTPPTSGSGVRTDTARDIAATERTNPSLSIERDRSGAETDNKQTTRRELF